MRSFLIACTALMFLTVPAAAQTTCSGHRDACFKACGSSGTSCSVICADAYAGCMKTGTWSGRLFKKSGLTKR